jgi:HEAT repeat protein
MFVFHLTLTPNEIKLKIDELGKEQASELLKSIYSSSNDYQERIQAIKLLAELGGNKNFNIIENALLCDENPYVRILAANLIGEYFEEQAIEPLKWALKDKSANVFRNACEELIKKSPKTIVDILINNLSSYSPTFRNIAAEMLIQIGEPAIKPLIAAATSKNPDTRRQASKALQKMDNLELIKSYITEIIPKKKRQNREFLLSLIQKIDKLKNE